MSLALERDVAGEVHPLGVDEVRLQRLEPDRCCRGEAIDDRADLVAEHVVLEHLAHEPDAKRVHRPELVGEHVELAGLRRADDAGKRPRPTHVPRDADLEERRVEPRRRGREAEVARARPSEPGTRARAVDRGDRDRGHVVQEHRSAEVRRRKCLVGDRAARDGLQVGARAERRSRASQDEHPDVSILRRVGERITGLAHHAVGHRVLAVGTVHRDRHDRTVLLVEDRLEARRGHRVASSHTMFDRADLETVTDLVADAWTAGADRDWSAQAGTVEWSCTRTADHAVDCVFAPAFFLAVAPDRCLPGRGRGLHPRPRRHPGAARRGTSDRVTDPRRLSSLTPTHRSAP